MPWYRTGTVSVTNNSKTVTGSGTGWASLSPFALVGSAFRGPDFRTYEVESVAGATSLTLVEPYQGSTASGQSYGIMPTLGLASDLAVAVSQLLNSTAGMFNTATDTGKTLLAIGSAADARTALGINDAIVAMLGAAWTTAGVVVSPSAGALSNANASVTYLKIGRMVFWTGVINVVTNGSAGGALRLTMPFVANKPTIFSGRENTATGAMLQGFLGANSNVLFVYRYDNGYPGGDNRVLYVSGVYEAVS